MFKCQCRVTANNDAFLLNQFLLSMSEIASSYISIRDRHQNIDMGGKRVSLGLSIHRIIWSFLRKYGFLRTKKVATNLLGSRP